VEEVLYYPVKLSKTVVVWLHRKLVLSVKVLNLREYSICYLLSITTRCDVYDRTEPSHPFNQVCRLSFIENCLCGIGDKRASARHFFFSPNG